MYYPLNAAIAYFLFWRYRKSIFTSKTLITLHHNLQTSASNNWQNIPNLF